MDGLELGNPGFVGRQAELAAISVAAGAAVESTPSVVWIAGEAGSGKTYLMRQALQRLPPGFHILRAEADELASDLAFHVVEQLGLHQASAPFPAGLALLERWGRLQTDGPVAVAVEDLHWADPESRAALLVAARRLARDRVLLLVTSRPSPGPADGWDRLQLDPERCLLLSMAPLSLRDVYEMARQSGFALSEAAAERLFRHTSGHPLYARTLLTELAPEQLARGGGPLPAPRSLASATVTRLVELPQGARDLAAALAVLNQRTPLAVAARVGGVPEPSQALDSLLPTGFVDWQAAAGRGVAIAHPLYRAAIYDDLPPSRRQQLHQAAAEVLGGRTALSHRVAAADTADDVLAAQVEAVALEDGHAHHFSAAATQLLSAAHLSSSPTQAEERLLRAARLLLAGGQTAQVEALRPRLEACTASPARSLVLGILAWDQGDAALAEKFLTAAAGLPGAEAPGRRFEATSDTTADALAQLANLYATQVRPLEAAAAAAAAMACSPLDPGLERGAATIEAMAQAMLRGANAGLERFFLRLPARAEDVETADVDSLVMRGMLHYFARHLALGISDLRAATRLAHQGAALQLPRAHLHLAQLLFDTGEWDEALVQGHVALSLLSDERRTWVEAQAYATLSWVPASRGQWKEAEGLLRKAESAATELGTSEARSATLQAKGTLARAKDDTGAVIEALSPLEESLSRYGAHVKIGPMGWYPWLVAAFIEQGDVKAARKHLDRLRTHMADRGLDFTALIIGLEARLCAAEGQLDRAEAAFRQAAARLGPDDPLLDRASVHHAFGRFLCGRGARREGTGQLQNAYDLLVPVGAVPFIKRVEDDLALSGTNAPPAAERSPLDLTDREGDVVSLVAKGLTNREIATQLYVTVNTVEYHMRNVFAKLGINSRRELRGILVRG